MRFTIQWRAAFRVKSFKAVVIIEWKIEDRIFIVAGKDNGFQHPFLLLLLSSSSLLLLPLVFVLIVSLLLCFSLPLSFFLCELTCLLDCHCVLINIYRDIELLLRIPSINGRSFIVNIIPPPPPLPPHQIRVEGRDRSYTFIIEYFRMSHADSSRERVHTCTHARTHTHAHTHSHTRVHERGMNVNLPLKCHFQSKKKSINKKK